MNFRNISAWSIRNPVVPIILFVGLMLLGFVSFSKMKIQEMPDIEFPAAMVIVAQPGAAPTEIETQITQKVEAAIRTLEGVDTIQSTANEGSSQTMVMFQVGTDINEAVNEVKNAVDQARGEMPDGILEPQVVKLKGGGNEIGFWAVPADDMRLEQLSWFIDDTLSKRLLAADEIAAVRVELQFGDRLPDAQRRQHQMRPAKPPAVAIHRLGQPKQGARGGSGNFRGDRSLPQAASSCRGGARPQ